MAVSRRVMKRDAQRSTNVVQYAARSVSQRAVAVDPAHTSLAEARVILWRQWGQDWNLFHQAAAALGRQGASRVADELHGPRHG
jgi:hypothetical protein